MFDGPDELADRITYLLANPEKRDAVAYRGFERVCREHTYDQRFEALLKKLTPQVTQRPLQSLDWPTFEQIVRRHRMGLWLTMT